METRKGLVARTVLLVLIMLSAILPAIIISPSTYADTDVFYSFNDGYNYFEIKDDFCSENNSVYETVRNASTGGPMDLAATNPKVGQAITGCWNTEEDEGYNVYMIWRSYLSFDTSAIPDNAYISSAVLRLHGKYSADGQWYLTITEGMPDYPHDPLVDTDYNRANYNTEDLGHIYSTSWSGSSYNNLVMTSDGLATINKTGITKFCLRSDSDINGDVPPDGSGDLIFYSSLQSGTSYDPRLEITYTVPVGQVTVTTQDADTITETGARLVGQVIEDGGVPCAVWFQYGLTGSYGLTTISQEGYWEGNTFSDFVAGLQRGQLYYYRAVASNGDTTGNGTQKTFITPPAKPSGFTATAGDALIDLAWTKGNGAQNTMIRYLTTGSYPQSPTAGAQAYFDTDSDYEHNTLDNDTTYAYSAWSWATEGGLSAYSISYVTAFATPRLDAVPTIITNDATDVTQNSATLYGYLSSLGGYGYVEVSFQWYKDGGAWIDHETTPQYQYTPGLFDADISGLDADSLYYFRAKGENGAGIAYGDSNYFTTGAVSAPTMLTLPATAKTKTSATIHGVVSNDGGASVIAWFEWGKTVSYEYTSSSVSGLVTDSTLYLNLDALEPDTTYHYRFVGSNYYGGVLRTGYGEDMTFNTLAPSLPVVTTQAAITGASSATLNGFLVDDGGIACEVRFQWYAEDEVVWANESGWQSGKRSNNSFNYYITDLDIGKTYYYRAQARNNDDIASGSTRSFVVALSAPINFIANTVSSYAIELTWILGGDQTYIVVKPTGYPTSRIDGTLVYFGSSNTYVHIGLNSGQTYYYRAWSWITSGNFTDSYSDAIATTLAPGAGEQEPPVIIMPPNKPSRWDSTPDPTALSGMILYGVVNDVAVAIGMPLGTFWLLLAILLSVIIGLGVYMLAHSAVIATIAMGLTLLGGWWLFIVPLWIIAVMGIIGTGVIYLERRL